MPPWSRVSVILLVALYGTSPFLRAQSPHKPSACHNLESAAHIWLRKNSGAAQSQLILRDCARYGPARPSALAHLVLGVGESRAGLFTQAVADFQAAGKYAPLADVADFEQGRELLNHGQAAMALPPLLSFLSSSRSSPLRGAALLKAAKAAQQTGNWRVVLQVAPWLPSSPQLEFWRGEADEALARAAPAVAAYKRVYFDSPTSPFAGKAGLRLRRIWRRLPQFQAGWSLYYRRGLRLLHAGRAAAAQQSLLRARTLAPAGESSRFSLPLAEAELALGRNAALRRQLPALLSGRYPATAHWLELRLALRENRPGEAARALNFLARQRAAPNLYARALVLSADLALNQHHLVQAERGYDRFEARFPRASFAAAAAWRAAWLAYRLRQPSARARFERYLRHYPRAAQAGDALYWLGSMADKSGEKGLAAECYRAAAIRYPQTYFGHLAALRAARLRRYGLKRLPRYFYHLVKPETAPRTRPIPPPARWQWRRGKWLNRVWLPHAAVRLVLPQFWHYPRSLALAESLSDWEARNRNYSASIQILKTALPPVERLSFNQLPPRIWKQLYPYPFSRAIEAAARRFSLPTPILLGLIRQESDFNPLSLSYAHARGLMQLELATARSHARELGLDAISAANLFLPRLNLQLGAAELAKLRRRFSNNPAYMLAAYNAGPYAVENWLNADSPHSQAYFIESIPYVQTRHYVQIVLSNARIYSLLYKNRRYRITPTRLSGQ